MLLQSLGQRRSVGSTAFQVSLSAVLRKCSVLTSTTALPMYTAAKQYASPNHLMRVRRGTDEYSGAVGLVRSYGKYLPEERITLNAVCPHVLRTGISTATFYDDLESKGLLTPIDGVVESFEKFIDSDMSGECMEIGPVGGPQVRAPPEVLNKESEQLNERLYHRGHPLHEVKAA